MEELNKYLRFAEKMEISVENETELDKIRSKYRKICKEIEDITQRVTDDLECSHLELPSQ